MKILFLNLYSNKVERGAESFTHKLAKRLSKNHQATFLKGNSALLPTSQFSGSLLNKITKRLFLDKSARQVLSFTLNNTPHILKSNYDVIFPLNGFWQLLILKLLRPIKGYKIIVTGHSGPGWDDRWNLYLHPNTFVALTKPSLTWAKKTSPWTKSVLIPLAIDSSKSSTSNKNKSKHTKLIAKLEKPIILCPAALVSYKRVNLAIKAVSKLKKGSLLVLGKGPQKKKLEKFGHKLLGKSSFLITSAPHSQMPAYYHAADIVTLPSDPQENSPMVFLEALATGKIVVTTNTPRNRWILEDNGIFTNPTNIRSYTTALQRALNIKPKTKALQKFTWRKVLSEHEKLISTLR